MLYIDNKNTVYEEKPEDKDTQEMMTIKEACKIWQVEGSWARRIAPKVPGAKQVILHGRNTWIIPSNAEKPTKNIKKGD